MDKIIYRLPSEDCYAYTDAGTRVEAPFWDWCCEEVIIQTYVEQGYDPETALLMFWTDVINWGYEKGYDVPYDIAHNAACQGGFEDPESTDEFLVNYYDDMGFIELPADDDPNYDD